MPVTENLKYLKAANSADKPPLNIYFQNNSVTLGLLQNFWTKLSHRIFFGVSKIKQNLLNKSHVSFQKKVTIS